MARIELRNIRKSYNDFLAIKGIDLSINDKEFIVFVGPSGCGKTTLLRMIAGLEEITSGDFLIDDVRANDISADKRGLAMVFQSYALYPHMTVAENMSFSLRMANVPKAQIKESVQRAASMLQLDKLLDRKPRMLSGGQRQRVAIGRAIVRNPKGFLFDEPLSNLDAALRVQMRTELIKLNKQLETTMIYVTHDQTEAMTMADRIAVLHDGQLAQFGTPLELYHNPENAFVAGFIGSPKANFFSGRVLERNEHSAKLIINESETIDVVADVLNLSPGMKVKVGIRPEHLKISQTGNISGIVDFVEHLGNETMVHMLNQNNELMTVRGDELSGARIGEKFSIISSPERVMVFDENDKNMVYRKIKLHKEG